MHRAIRLRLIGVAWVASLVSCSDFIRFDGGNVTDSDAADAGVIAAPRQIAPLSTSIVTSRRPTLHWSLAPGTDGARVDICRDRACSATIATLDAAGSSVVPILDLPSGVVYWRVRGRTEARIGVASSPTWQFTAGRRTAPIDTSSGTVLDVNGDGYADVVVGSPYAMNGTGSSLGRVHLFLGGPAGIATTPATSLASPDGPGSNFGVSVASAGDTNGDGYADVVVGAVGGASAPHAHLYLGGPAGLATTPAHSLTMIDGSGAFGFSVSSAGDVNGDGYADVIVGSPFATSATGRADLYLGGPAGLATIPATSLTGPDGMNGSFGWSVASAGDVNGDGFADVAVGARGAMSNTGRAHLYLGGPAGLAPTPSASLTGPDASGFFGVSVASAGDINGDGYSDVIVGARDGPPEGRAYLYLGGGAGLATTAATSLIGPDSQSGFGFSVAGAGDTNGDGYADVVVGVNGAMNNTGRAHLYLGGPAGLATPPAISLTGPDAGGLFGLSVASAGDTNGDGYADVVVGAPGGAGRAHVYLGGPAGLGTTPASSITGPDGSAQFGVAVASADSVGSNAPTGLVAATRRERNCIPTTPVELHGEAQRSVSVSFVVVSTHARPAIQSNVVVM